jgi:NTP pyrophosphatase (non-canonical NTP hydrolase)
MNSRKAKTVNATKATFSGQGIAIGAPVDSRPMTEHDYRKAQLAAREHTKQQIGATLAVMLPAFVFQLEQLQQQVYAANDVQGFWDEFQHTKLGTPAKLALMHSEISEALEADRKNIESDDKIPEFTGLEAELADLVIRVLDFAGANNLRLGEAIQAKLLFNLTRPVKHGKAY